MPGEERESLRLDTVEAAYIRKVLDRSGGKVEGRNGAAERLDMNPGTLRHRTKKLGIAFEKRASQGTR